MVMLSIKGIIKLMKIKILMKIIVAITITMYQMMIVLGVVIMRRMILT